MVKIQYEEPKIIVLNEKALGGSPYSCGPGSAPNNPGGKGSCGAGYNAGGNGGCAGGYTVV
ncbi:SynChlorMet cassette protein ScmA [Methanocella paludicola]|uniref:SynChlorMet cassette protein ScmA n=1 Tax=Methanocella paludicola TaxID=570267 RepID=UPI000FFBC321|nr:SynChlorMet cassette protein ScmA [Methanocella paludicola]